MRIRTRIVNKNDKYKSVESSIRNKYKNNVFRAVNMVRNTAVDNITSGGNGRVYEKYNPRRTHTASAVGDYPASDTGYLVNHIYSNIVGDGLTGEIVSSAEYSSFLEFGTSTMQARPFMQPSLEENRQKIKKLFRNI